MIRPQLVLDFNEEIHIDNFAGGGGASMAYEMATGRCVDIAVNHNRLAVAMHRANHPQCRHFIEDVFEFDVLKEIQGRPVGSVWFSPDCKHFSKAKGGTLIDKKIRGLAWLLVKYAGIGGGRQKEGRRGPACGRVFYLENVEEFQTWGPLVCKRDVATGRCVKVDGSIAAKGEVVPIKSQWLVPCKKRAGSYFKQLKRQLFARGATAIEHRTKMACKAGAPTIRDRFYMVVRFDGNPIVWRQAGWADRKSAAVIKGEKKPYRSAAECIDFSIPIHSIFMPPVEAKRFRIKRPLVYNSEHRIAIGVQRYVMNGEPFIIGLGDLAAAGFTATNTTKHTGAPVTDPVSTIATGVHQIIAGAFVAHQQHGGAVRSASSPIHTIAASAKDQNQVVAVSLAQDFGQSVGSPVVEPVRAVMPGGLGKTKVCAVSVAQYNGSKRVDETRGQSADEALNTIPTENRFAVTAHFLAQNNTGVIGHEAQFPFSTILSRGTNQSLVSCSLIKYYGNEKDGVDITGPCHTVTTKDRFGLTVADLGVPPLTRELAEKARRVAAWLRSHDVEVPGEFAMCGPLVIWDIAMRMFTPRELFRAQGFPEDYIIEYGIDESGEVIPLTKTTQVACCGNSVSPPPAAEIIADNSPEQVLWDRRMAA